MPRPLGVWWAATNFDVDVTVGRGAHALVTTQAAEKVYRSIGLDSRVAVNLHLATDGWLEWFPQETIIFDGARLRRQITLSVTDGARCLADVTIYVIDVVAGDKIPRKGGPAITRSDLLRINKTDLAPLVGADLAVMARDARKMRGSKPTVFTNLKSGDGVDTVAGFIVEAHGSALNR